MKITRRATLKLGTQAAAAAAILPTSALAMGTDGPGIDDKLLALCRKRGAIDAGLDANSDTITDSEINAGLDADNAVMAAIAETPAESFIGVNAKMALAEDLYSIEYTDMAERLMASARADMQRLAPLAA